MAESIDFRPVLREVEAKRLASEEKRERQLAIREDKDREALNKIDQKLKTANATQKKSLEAQKLQIQIDAKERASEGMRVSDQVQAIKDQKDAQAEIAKKIEANGGKADQNLDFLKRNNRIQIEELKLAQSQATSPSQQKEIAKDLRKARIEGLKLALDPVIAPITSFASIGKRILGTSFGVPGLTLGRLALLAALPLIIKFLRSDMFDNIIDSLKDLDLKKIGDNIKNSVIGLGGALAAIGLTIARATAMLSGAAGIRGAGSLVRDTKLTAKGLIGKDEIIKSGDKRFKLDPKGMLREIDKEGKFTKAPVQNQQKLLQSLAKEGSLGERGKLLGADAKGNKFLRSITGVLKRVPFLSQIFAIGDLVSILGGSGTKEEKIKGLVGVLGGLGGGTLGAILGGIVGSFIPVVGNLIGSVGGGIFGYFAGKNTAENLAEGIAQFAVGAKVTAFDGSIFGVDLNSLLSGGGGNPFASAIAMQNEAMAFREMFDTTTPASRTTSPTRVSQDFVSGQITTEQAAQVRLGTGPIFPGMDLDFMGNVGLIDDEIKRLDALLKPTSVSVDAENVNLSGNFLTRFATALAEFGSRNAGQTASINTIIKGGDQTMQGGRSQVNVLTHADPMHRAILSSVAN